VGCVEVESLRPLSYALHVVPLEFGSVIPTIIGLEFKKPILTLKSFIRLGTNQRMITAILIGILPKMLRVGEQPH